MKSCKTPTHPDVPLRTVLLRGSVYFDGVMQMTRPFCDEAFGKIMEEHSLEEFNDKIHFPDSNDRIVKQLNDAIKIRMKIIKAKKEREDLAG
jgi:hypothetical protein